MLSDVVLVGAGTLRQEGYDAMRAGPAGGRRGAPPAACPPTRTLAVVSAGSTWTRTSPVFTEAPGPPARAHPRRRAAGARAARCAAVADVVVCGDDGRRPGPGVGDAAPARGLTQVLCEGGPHLLGTLVAADVVDELCLTLSPVLEGGGAGPDRRRRRRDHAADAAGARAAPPATCSCCATCAPAEAARGR